jgi:hypothetical protein
VYTKTCKKSSFESETCFPDSHSREKVGIHIESKFGIESPSLKGGVGLPECARLMQEESTIQVPPAHKGCIAVLLNHLITRVDSVQVSVDDIRTLAFPELGRHALQRFRHVNIVGVEVRGNDSRHHA